MNNIEILAPAGSYDSFRAALAAGADAVYAGGPRFGARAFADNFTEEKLKKAIEEAHLYGRKFYLTVNTLLKNMETDCLYDYLAPLYERGLDAVIVQDIGVLSYIRKQFPDLDIHASTQMTITDAWGAIFLEKQGATRIVPARELSTEEILRIRKMTNLEIECFVHGALCYCYSGQCLMSSMIGGRSGNRGQCAQPCRLPYTANGQKKYFLSLKDMCTLELIPDLIDSGINSMKIEGRMKKPEYVAAVTAMYRKYTDLYLKKGREHFHVMPEDREMLMDLYNRGGSGTGYYRQHNGTNMLSLERSNHTGVPAVRVISQNGREVRGHVLTDLHPGDVLDLAGGRQNHTVGKEIKKGGDLTFLVSKGLRFTSGTVFSRIRNNVLINTVKDRYLSSHMQEPISGFFSLRESCPAVLTVQHGNVSFSAASREIAQKAIKAPVSERQVQERLSRTGETPFHFDRIKIEMDDNLFFPMQCLNNLRRDALEGLARELAHAQSRVLPLKIDENMKFTDMVSANNKQETHTPVFSVFVETIDQLSAVSTYIETEKDHHIGRVYFDYHMNPNFFDMDLIVQKARRIREHSIKVFVALPRIIRKNTAERLEQQWQNILRFPADGMLIRNYESWEFLSTHKFDKPVILDHNLYVFNRHAREFWSNLGVRLFTAPLELTFQELSELDVREQEFIIYGMIPVMVSAQCVVSASEKCNGASRSTELTDRYHNRFPVKSYCDSCFSVIYHPDPLYLGNRQNEIRQLGVAALRIQFSTEDAEQVLSVLHLLKQMSAIEEEEPEFSYTQGHFKRGVL